MLIYHPIKTIFTRVPGTASSSFITHMHKRWGEPEKIKISTAPIQGMNNISDNSHRTAHQLKLYLEEIGRQHIWDEYEKIAFVRHPVAWTNSIFRKTGIPQSIGENNKGSYRHYLESVDKTPYYWFTDPKGKVLVDYIFRTEDLDSEVFEIYGIAPPFSRHSVSRRPKFEPNEGDWKLLRKKFKREFAHYDNIP